MAQQTFRPGHQHTPGLRLVVTLTIAAFFTIAALLVWGFDVAPFLDYPNHYARIWLISGGITTAPFDRIYALDWSLASTNLGIDLLALWLGPLAGADLLARSVLYLAIVLPVTGIFVLGQRLFPGIHPWQIAILFCAWSTTLIGGFINFQIGLGLALLLAVVDDRLANRPVAGFIWRMVAAYLLIIVHVFAMAFFTAVVCGLLLPASFSGLRTPTAWLRLAQRITLAVLACAIPLALVMAGANGMPGDHATGIMGVWDTHPLLVAQNLLSAIGTYMTFIDVLFLIPLLLVVTSALREKQFRLHAGLLVACAGLVVVSLVSPRNIFGTGWISWRFPIMALLVFVLAFRPWPDVAGKSALKLAGILALCVFARTAWVGYNWWQYQDDVRDVRAVLAAVPAGAAILPLGHNPSFTDQSLKPHRYFFIRDEDTFRHLATLAVPQAHAFVPAVFTAKGKQPLKVLEPWTALAVPEGNLVKTSQMRCPTLFEKARLYDPYLDNWRQGFDFILLLNADLPDRLIGDVPPAAGGIGLIASTDFARLYKIDRNYVAPPQSAPPAGCENAILPDALG